MAGDLDLGGGRVLREELLKPLELSDEPLAVGLRWRPSGGFEAAASSASAMAIFCSMPRRRSRTASEEPPSAKKGRGCCLASEAGDLGGELLRGSALVAERAFDGFVEGGGDAVDAAAVMAAGTVR